MGYKKSIGVFFEETIGDLICTSSIVASIRKNEPEANIHVVTSDLGLEVLKSDKPDYNTISKRFNDLHNYDTICYPIRCLQRVPWWFKHGMHMRDLAAHSIGVELSVKSSNIVQPTDKDVSDQCRDITKQRYIIVSNRASRDRLKEVPLETMNKAMEKISNKYPTYQLGVSQDPPLSNCKSLLGETTITEALYLIKNASLVISIDNYLLHAAGSYGTPFVGIYGQYRWEQVGPIDKKGPFEIINKGIINNYNPEGCTKITADEILLTFEKMEGRI